MIFDGLGALGSDVGVQGRFFVKKGYALRQKCHPSGGSVSILFSTLFDTVFEKAPGSNNHSTLIQKLWIWEIGLVTFLKDANMQN